MTAADAPELELFVALAEALDELVFVWKASGEMLWTNSSFVRESGLSVEDFGFRNEQNPIVHADDLPRVLTELGAFVASDAQRSAPIANRFIDVWGRTRGVSTVVSKIRWRGEPALLLISTFQAQPGTEDVEASYRQLVDSAEDGILKVSADGTVVYSNRRFQKMIGKRVMEVARQPLEAHFHADDRSRVRGVLDRLTAGEERVSLDARLVTSSGETRWVSLVLNPLALDPAAAYLVIARDVTEERRLEGQLRQRQRLESLGLLVGGIAHDLNNIVTSVLANASFAEAMVEPGSTLEEIIRDIRAAGDRARALNCSLLAYAGRAAARVEAIDLRRVVDDTVRLVAPLLDKSVRVERACARVADIRGDGTQLAQVVLNLITNAAEAIGARPGRVLVRTAPCRFDPGERATRWIGSAPGAGDYVLLEVTDDGCGMPDDVLERIFDPFFTTKSEGRGLGLSALLGIVNRHDGHLGVETAVGRGTTFRVLLPPALELSPALGSARAPPATRPLASGRVLVVDDEAGIREVGRRILGTAGYEVVVAANATAALSLFQSDPGSFAAAVLDRSMPGMKGPELARRLRALRPRLPIVQSSGCQDTTNVGLNEEAAVVLAKPYSADELIEAVARAREWEGTAVTLDRPAP